MSLQSLVPDPATVSIEAGAVHSGLDASVAPELGQAAIARSVERHRPGI
jgi:hypothetical protein